MAVVSLEQASTIYVSFNNKSSITNQEYFKTPKQELCDKIGFAAKKKTGMNWRTFRDTYHVDLNSISNWLGVSDCILFADELNLLTPVSVDITKLLKTLFLIPKGRAFCFSSHLGTISFALKAYAADPSNHKVILWKLPLVSSLSEARRCPKYHKLGVCEAIYFGLIPRLLTEVKLDQHVTTRQKNCG